MCDLDLEGTDLGVARDTPPCGSERMCKVICELIEG